ncbi:hypothetical protein [Sphingobacterium lactis]|uniref:Uncharacterized protein n=1 Tax=Sphingobacterium lactis TaxID=797291 RepID=A0A1H6C4Z9_9SPHI|nr:hypothetical protein [Sphingobacterium lactis]SEG67797.1 hypothetical protein SAMN05421877_11342 [Sphingobacterium lactis]
MKNKIHFILPRLLVITALVGIFSLIIGALFKILLLGTVVVGIGAFVMSRIRKRRMLEQHYLHTQRAQFAQGSPSLAISPIIGTTHQTKATIIPIY